MFKKISVILLAALIMMSLTSCGVKQSVDEKIAEKVTEGVINKATDGEVDLDYKEGQVTVKGEDGEKVTFGDSEWPKGQAADLIPKFKKGNIISVINAEKACIVVLEKVELQDFEKYVEELKSQGFSNDVSVFSIESSRNYSAKLNETTAIIVLYDGESKSLTINLEIRE